LELLEVEEEFRREDIIIMTAKTESYAGCKILSVGGRIDFESAMEFERHVNAMIREASDYYIIELSKVELLSSAGLRVMLSTAKRVAQRNAALALAAPSSVVRQVFEISHFNLLFKIFASVPDAITALKGTPVGPEASVHRAPVPGAPVQQEPKIPEAVPVVTRPPEEVETPRVEPPVIAEPHAGPPPVVPPPIVSSRPETVEALPEPISRPAVGLSAGDAPTVAPPSFPQGEGPAAGSPVQRQVEVSNRQVQPPPLPPKQSIPVPPPTRPGSAVARIEAQYPARLEIRAEGTSYPCKDGDVIGTEGKLAQPFFSQVTNLAARHLLIGQLDGRWFVFTPKNVQLPFTLDGVILRVGERKMLQYVEHQVEFSGHVFGFRLLPEQGKEGFFSRVFRTKK
jgi:anti-sigma B factor antagonist